MDSRNGKPGKLQRRELLALLAATFLVGGCSLLRDDLRPPGITLVSITPATSTITELGFRCRLRLDNPNDIDLPIKGGELTLTLADRTTAHGRLADDVTIPAHAATEVDAVVSIGVMSAVSIIANLLDRPDAMIPYSVEGYVDVGVSYIGRIHFDENGEFSLNGAGDIIRAGL